MATFNQNGIQFTATKGSVLPGKYGNGDNGNFTDAETEGVNAFVNAVEIDWNNAKLTNNITINTTGQLLKIVSDLYNEIFPPVTYSLSFNITPNDKGYDFWINSNINSDSIIPGKKIFVYNNLTYQYKRSDLDIHIIKTQSNEEINFIWVGYSNRFVFTMPEEDVIINITVTDPESEYGEGVGNNSYNIDFELYDDIELSSGNFKITADDDELPINGVIAGTSIKIKLVSENYNSDEIYITSDQVDNIEWNSLSECWEFIMPNKQVILQIHSLGSGEYNSGTGGFDKANLG